MSLYLLLAVSLCAAAFGLYWSAKRAGITPMYSGVFAGCAVAAFLLGWAFRGGAAPEVSVVAPVVAPVVAATPNPALFHEALSELQFPTHVAASSSAKGSIVVQNSSALTWSTANGPILLGFHILAADGHPVNEGRALFGTKSLKPGEKRRVPIAAMMPSAPGQYKVKFDVIYEGYAWFESTRNRPVTVSVTVQ